MFLCQVYLVQTLPFSLVWEALWGYLQANKLNYHRKVCTFPNVDLPVKSVRIEKQKFKEHFSKNPY